MTKETVKFAEAPTSSEFSKLTGIDDQKCLSPSEYQRGTVGERKQAAQARVLAPRRRAVVVSQLCSIRLWTVVSLLSFLLNFTF